MKLIETEIYFIKAAEVVRICDCHTESILTVNQSRVNAPYGEDHGKFVLSVNYCNFGQQTIISSRKMLILKDILFYVYCHLEYRLVWNISV